MSATTTRRLYAVPDAPTVLETVAPAGRRKRLAADRADAVRATSAPEVVEEREAAITRALHRLAQSKTGRRQILDELAEAMLVLGYVNGVADQRSTPYLRLTGQTLAAVHVLEVAERNEARDAEKTILRTVTS